MSRGVILRNQLHDGQLAVLADQSRHRVVACGRRWGKSFVGLTALFECILTGGRAWWVSPTDGQAAKVYEQAVNSLFRLLQSHSDTAMTIKMANGGTVQFVSAATADNLRGEGLDLVVLDEAAFMPDGFWSKIIQPMLLGRQGRALFLSSPNGRNWFWKLTKTRGKAYSFHHYPTSTNPLISTAELEQIREEVPERIWREEYEAEFLEDSAAVFRNISAAIEDSAPPLLPGGNYVAGLDWGRMNDETALITIEAGEGRVIDIDHFTGVSFEIQRGRVQAAFDRWNHRKIVSETNSIGQPNLEALQSAGLPVSGFTTTARSKPHLIDDLTLALERGHLKIPRHQKLIDQLEAYECQRRADGGYSYSAPPGGHDDLVIALALAWNAAKNTSIGISWA